MVIVRRHAAKILQDVFELGTQASLISVRS